MFSVIICTYNGASRLKRVVEAVCSQTDYEQNVNEILIVDNCSTDSTRRVSEQLAEKIPKIHYLFENNPELSNARRCGILNATSPWIIFLDDDNFIQEGWVKEAQRYIETHIKMGAFNGNIIPSFDFALLPEQIELLKASDNALACSTWSEEQMVYVPENHWSPIGAGLVILREPLMRMLENGWLSLEGRNKTALTSGEDAEMVLWLRHFGYKWGFCNEMIMRHEISAHRLNLNYLKQLYYHCGIASCVICNLRTNTLFHQAASLLLTGEKAAKAMVRNILYRLKSKNRSTGKNSDYYLYLLQKEMVRGFCFALKEYGISGAGLNKIGVDMQKLHQIS